MLRSICFCHCMARLGARKGSSVKRHRESFLLPMLLRENLSHRVKTAYNYSVSTKHSFLLTIHRLHSLQKPKQKLFHTCFFSNSFYLFHRNHVVLQSHTRRPRHCFRQGPGSQGSSTSSRKPTPNPRKASPYCRSDRTRLPHLVYQ